jgi:hypothetical protein
MEVRRHGLGQRPDAEWGAQDRRTSKSMMRLRKCDLTNSRYFKTHSTVVIQ